MNRRELQKALSSLPLGELRYFDSIGSTNDEALAWAAQNARDLSLIVADEQTAGRGRSGRKWLTPPGTALAFSLILRPSPAEQKQPARTTGLGALALVDALRKIGFPAKIKWPNDVLVDGRKVAGVLVESVWTGEALDAFVLGMGVNVLSASAPPADQVLFPATSLQDELGHPLDRMEILRETLSALLARRTQLETAEFLQAWEDALAFHGELVEIRKRENELYLQGELVGLDADGSLRIRGADGRLHQVQFGEIHLRPA